MPGESRGYERNVVALCIADERVPSFLADFVWEYERIGIDVHRQVGQLVVEPVCQDGVVGV